MKKLILTDIYGKSSIPSFLIDSDTLILEPYKINENISNEKTLYNEFLKHCGHESYYKKALLKVKEFKPAFIIGFSAGASVAWRLSEYKLNSQIICFYPTQIRYHLNIESQVNTTVVFPKKEVHFDIEHIKQVLSKKEKVKILQSAALHGFFNPKSKNYDSEELKVYKELL